MKPGQDESGSVAPPASAADAPAPAIALPKAKPERKVPAATRTPPVKPTSPGATADQAQQGRPGSANPKPAIRSGAPGVAQQASAAETEAGNGSNTAQRVSLTFQPDQSRLDEASHARLDTMARALTGSGGRIKLVSYASGATPEGDRQLALNRALQVRSYLMSKGVPAEAIDVNVIGSTVAVQGEKPNRIDLVPVGNP